MPKSTLAGHPLHPMLVVAPAALLPFGFVSGWFGGRLVYEEGMRVKGVSPVQHDRDLKMLPGDEKVEKAMVAAETYVPSAGPVMH